MNQLVAVSSIGNLSDNWCYEDKTIGVTRIGQLVLRGWDNILITDAATTTTHAVLTITTHAVLTITTHAVIFHTLISYKRLRYIQPPLPARRSLLHLSWVPTLSLTRG